METYFFNDGKFNDFSISDFEQNLISEIMAEHDVEAYCIIGRKRNDVTDKDLGNYIRLIAGDYTVKIGINRINMEDIPSLFQQIEEDDILWNQFAPREKLWYGDSYVRCLSADHNNKVIVFE